MVLATATPLHQARRPPPADTRACYTRSPTTTVRSATSTRTCRVEAQFTASRTLRLFNVYTFTKREQSRITSEVLEDSLHWRKLGGRRWPAGEGRGRARLVRRERGARRIVR